MAAMAAETLPRTRIHLFHVKQGGDWVVWELEELVLPATTAELPFDRGPSPHEPGSSKKPDRDRAPKCVVSVLEVDADGEVEGSWPPCECTPDEV